MIRLQQGDRRAYQALYARWGARTLDFLLRRTGSRACAEDALQETWLRVFRYARSFEAGRPFPPWLFRIAARAGHDAREPEPDAFVQAGSYEADPVLRDRVLQALHGLDPEDRRLLLLNVEGFDATEIGEMSSMRPGTVRQRLTRVRRHLQGVLGEPDA
ncbi:MAG: RNA polymerase sigma factor [Pseudomonadota bacterium]